MAKLKEMNIRDLIQVFTRKETLINEFDGTPTIICPLNVFDRSITFCSRVEETVGVMLYTEATPGLLVVEAMIELSTGGAYQVEHNDKTLAAMNQMLRDHAHLRYIEFHTHTQTTGAHWFDKFSDFQGGDVTSLTNKLNRSNTYKHVLFTPTHILTFGLDKPKFIVIPNRSIEIEKRWDEWEKKFKEILKNT